MSGQSWGGTAGPEGAPFRVDGGNGGRGEDDGAFFLLPYWMARYHKLLLSE